MWAPLTRSSSLFGKTPSPDVDGCQGDVVRDLILVELFSQLSNSVLAVFSLF